MIFLAPYAGGVWCVCYVSSKFLGVGKCGADLRETQVTCML
jgi:hypothetical protein